MAMCCNGSKNFNGKMDTMRKEKWTTNQRSKNAAYETVEVKLTKEFLDHLCSLVKPCNICYSDSATDILLSEHKEKLGIRLR